MDPFGKVLQCKVRLVANGYMKKQSIEFDEVFARVVRIETIWILLVVLAKNGWLVHHLDVKLAFLYGDLEEEVCVTQP